MLMEKPFAQIDPRAARRFEIAADFMARGDHGAAADLLRQTIEEAPGWPALHFRLGEALEMAGREGEAAKAYARALALDPADTLGAAVRLALLGVFAPPEILPRAYVRELFDQYAPRFEESLVERLGYDVPRKLAALVARGCPLPARGARILDLGCGTGLCGAAFADKAAWLAGVDLSAAMLQQARKKGIYHELRQGDLLEALRGDDAQPWDLILAADVLIYMGPLAPVFRAVRARLAPKGAFVFSVQSCGGSGYDLGPDHRYSHARTYVETCAHQAALSLAVIEETSIRQEGGKDLAGLVGLAFIA